MLEFSFFFLGITLERQCGGWRARCEQAQFLPWMMLRRCDADGRTPRPSRTTCPVAVSRLLLLVWPLRTPLAERGPEGRGCHREICCMRPFLLRPHSVILE